MKKGSKKVMAEGEEERKCVAGVGGQIRTRQKIRGRKLLKPIDLFR